MATLVETPGFDDCYRGDSFCYTLQFDNASFDITGYQFFVTYKVSANDLDSAAVLIKRFTPPANVASESGKLYLPFESTDTNRFSPARYHYDIQMVTNNFPPKIVTLLTGTQTFLTDVTRLES